MLAAPVTDVYHAIADPRRRAILELLGDTERPVQAIVDRFDVSFAAISQHLKVLREAGLVVRRRDGRSQRYRATPSALKEVHDWTAQYQVFWRTRLNRLRTHLDEHP
jgi:DNA-binding transcriptional ArsR family regulator